MSLVIKKSKIKGAGMGLFAGRNFKKGEIIGTYKGKILTEKGYQKVKDESYIWYVRPNRYIDGRKLKKGNPLRYVNGAKGKKQLKKVNVEPLVCKNFICYKTIKRVPKGREFIVDYGDEYW